MPIDEKFKAFGWNVIIIDGHNLAEIEETIEKANHVKGKPSVIIAKTIKGKGVSFMENKAQWHGQAPETELYEQAIKELNAQLEVLS